ncbi:MAG: EAL domain-containing protein, partial [Thiohalobacteraceae bacterium]
ALPRHVSVMLLRDDGYRQYVHPLPENLHDARLETLYGQPVSDHTKAEIAALPATGVAATALPERGGKQYAAREYLAAYGLSALSLTPARVVWLNWLKGLWVPGAWLLVYLAFGYAMFRYAAARQVRSDRQLRSLNAWHEAILDAANYSIVATDIRGIIVSLNPAAEAMLGYRAEDLVGRASPEIFHLAEELERRARELSAEFGETIAPGFEALDAKPRRGEIEEREWTYVRSDGSTLPVMLSMSAVQAEDGSLMGFLGIASDISERKRTLADLHASETRYKALFEGAADAVFVMDGTKIVDCNAAAPAMFGCGRDQIVNMSPGMLSPERQPDGSLSQEKMRENILAVFAGRKTMIEWEHLRQDGTAFDAEVTLLVAEISGYPHVLATVRDITERKRTSLELTESRQALMQSNENLRLLNGFSDRLQASLDVESIADETLELLTRIAGAERTALYLVDSDGSRLRLIGARGFSKEMMQAGSYLPMHGSLNGAALLDGKPVAIDDIDIDPRAEPVVAKKLLKLGLRSMVVVPIYCRGAALGTITLMFAEPHGYGQSDLETMASVGNTVGLAIANARYIADLDYQATHDALTQLPNRLLLHREFARRVLQRPQGAAGASLMLLDLDRFKEVNDSLGHQVGDQLLCEIGRRLAEALTAYPSLICRLGGDEFAILLPSVHRSAAALQVGRDIVAALARPFTLNELTLQVGASVGVAVYPDDGADSHALLRAADVAMYAAKSAAAGVEQYDPVLDTNTPERLMLLSDFGRALRDQQLRLHYQPKLDLKSRRVTGFEALVRWEHPDRGLLYPGAFLPMIELTDAIQELTMQVLGMALQQQRDWRDQGLEYSIAINLSARNLLNYQCVSRLEELLAQYGADPEMLELEITETALMQDPESAAVLLNRIAALGIRLSIDDFGTGYSSLSYLRRLPISALKIDRSFVTDMVRDEQNAVIVRSTIGLAHNLNLQVIAEGVEDADVLAMLAEMCCDQAQGYFISRPLPAERVLEAIRRSAVADT